MYTWTKSKKKNVVIFWIILFLVLCYVMYCSPFVSDDLEFKKLNLFSIKDNIHHSLYYGNGRFLGNLGSVLLVNHKILSCVVRAFIISVLCILIPKNCNCNTEVSYIFSTILIVGIQPELFGEMYGWISGFQNYVPPVFLTSVIVAITKYKTSSHLITALLNGIIILLGVCSQLYVETSTLFNIILSFLMLYIIYKKRGTSHISKHVCWFISTAAGAAIMFLIPKIFFIENNRTSGYRSVHISSLGEFIYYFFYNALRLIYYFSDNFPVIIITLLIAYFFFANIIRQNKVKFKYASAVKSLLIFCLCYICIDRLYFRNAYYSFNLFDYVHAVASTMIFFFAFIILIYSLMYSNNIINPQIGIIALSLVFVSIAPMLLVSPVHRRALYLPCMVLTCFYTYLMDSIVEHIDLTKSKLLLSATKVICLLVLAGLCVSFSNIKYLSEERERNIYKQINDQKTSIETFDYPKNYVFWDHNWVLPEYYSVNKHKLDFIILDYNTWYDNAYKYNKY